ncbi:S8 family peptidase [Mycolicibacterium porcinum]|uniref:S8 family peptidase n=1 Tax=Mycolicibacterium porcinum TaxID=39693 RepID=UPI000848EA3A|nr:S8 family peptidase [Mycolicibacterium porcinum]ODR24892.1 peptidase S8 [Mycolicibacterium porcinum]
MSLSSDSEIWTDRVQCALADLAAEHIDASPQKLLEAVAARFASRFDADDRLGVDGTPKWHRSVDDAVGELVRRKQATRRRPAKKTGAVAPQPIVRLTAAGQAAAEQACDRAMAPPEPVRTVAPATPEQPPHRDLLVAGVITPPLREKFVVAPGEDPERVRETLWPIMIELNLRFAAGVAAAVERVHELWRLVGGSGEPVEVADQFMAGELTTRQIEGIVSADSVPQQWPERAVYRIWPDFDAHPQIDASSNTVKALPAQRTFACYGSGIVWAVVDSGIDETHAHFKSRATVDDPTVHDLHRDFTVTGGDKAFAPSALQDADGHGSHVAGIIAGGLPEGFADEVYVAEKRFNVGAPEGDIPILQKRVVSDPGRLAGMAPEAKLVSLKVLGPGEKASRVSRVMRALAYVREVNAASERMPRIHGVNLSLGYEFAAEWFACGQSPLCIEVDKTVRSGVVVVAAAGNSGYVSLNPLFTTDVTKFSAGMTINDPGNAERAITVGSTHRDAPHTSGVSYFSSKGPTGDGRRKPDLLAPGERITSVAAGKFRSDVLRQTDAPQESAAIYIEATGTSMAAPHVSGAIAAFLSVQRELIGQPDEIKRVFTESATSLGRDPAFQGGGLLDLMRALQSV